MASKENFGEQDLIVSNIPVYYISEQDFHQQLLQFFRPYIHDGILNGQFDWNCFEHAKIHFSLCLEHPELMSVYIEVLFGILEDLSIVDPNLVMWLLIEYTKRRLESYGFYLGDSELYYYLGERSGRFRNTIVPQYEHIMLSCGFLQLLNKPFLFQDLDFVKRVLRYVMPPKLTTEDLSSYVKNVFKRIRKDATLNKVVNDEDFHIEHSYPPLRLKFIVMAIDFVVSKRVGYSFGQNSIDSLNLFFEAIPDALITVKEAKDFLKFFIKNRNEEAKDSLEDFCRSFIEEFPESDQPRQPRSLAHYSRCEIRKCLSISSNLPHGVKRLGLPKTLQNYVLLQNREFEFHPRFNTLSKEKKFKIRM